MHFAFCPSRNAHVIYGSSVKGAGDGVFLAEESVCSLLFLSDRKYTSKRNFNYLCKQIKTGVLTKQEIPYK